MNHFAGKRFPNKDVYIFASKNHKDARKVINKDLRGHRVHLAIAGRAEMFGLEALLNGHQVWLSEKIPEWDGRYLSR